MSAKPLYRLDETLWCFSFMPGNANFPEKIYIQTPGFSNRAVDYELADVISDALSQAPNFATAMTQGVDLSKEKKASTEIQKKWELCDTSEAWSKKLQKGSFYNHSFNSLKTRVIELRPASYYQKATNAFSSGIAYLVSWVWTRHPYVKTTVQRQLVWQEGAWQESLINNGAFTDPFTSLAKEALQTDETSFVSEQPCTGSYRFELKNNLLRLVPIADGSAMNTTVDDIRAAVVAYRDYLKKTFAWRILDSIEKKFQEQLEAYPQVFNTPYEPEEQLMGYLQCTLGIDFELMIKEGKPLLPDHVFKCNIAVNNIEMPRVESLFLRIDRLLKSAKYADNIPLDTPSQWMAFLISIKVDSYFSLREIRGMYCSFRGRNGDKKPTSAQFREYIASFNFMKDLQPSLNELIFGDKIRDLTPRAFHQLMEILLVDTDLIDLPFSQRGAQDNFWTGRKIVHLGICGYKTMGNKKVFDPARNRFELLHIYRTLAQGNWNMLSELLAHVVVKKSLWSHYPARSLDNPPDPANRERRVALLIPFPDQGGEKRWYYVDGLLNDGGGDFNYVLVPACKGYVEDETSNDRLMTSKRVPLIKLYRSTASDGEAESSIDTLLADTNPKKIGALDFKRGDEYEVSYFNRCTIPVWVGYLISGKVAEAVATFQALPTKKVDVKSMSTQPEDKIDMLKRFLVWQMARAQKISPEDAPERAQNVLQAFIQGVGQENFETYLTTSLQAMEWEKQKLAQDVLFIGHSLGGALSQSGCYHFGAEQDRIPLFGCIYRCITYDSPGVTLSEARGFIQFGRRHKVLLKSLSQRWEINFQFEFQDLVPEGGTCFLGVQDHEPGDEEWLKIEGSVCKPAETAQDLTITTTPTHGRRFWQAQQGQDYVRTILTLQHLNDLKQSWLLSRELRGMFGYRLTTPRISEIIRRGIPGTAAFTYFWTKKQIKSLASPVNKEADKDGVEFFTYKGKGQAGGYVGDVRPMI